GHASFRQLAWRKYETGCARNLANEYQRTESELHDIHNLGGFVSVGLNQGDVRDFSKSGMKIRNDSAGSSKSWAQAYLYAAAHMQSEGVPIGTDMNGLAGAPCPRFGRFAAFELRDDPVRKPLRKMQRQAQTDPVVYVGTHDAGEHVPLIPCRAGSRVFDI